MAATKHKFVLQYATTSKQILKPDDTPAPTPPEGEGWQFLNGTVADWDTHNVMYWFWVRQTHAIHVEKRDAEKTEKTGRGIG